MKFGENLQKLRKEKGISQEQLAEQLGVTRQSVSKWESNSSYPEMDKLVTICQIFNCDLDSLINKDITQEKNKQEATSVVKKILTEITTYIKKTIFLLEHKSLKDIIKILAQVLIILLVIYFLRIPFNLIENTISTIFYSSDNVVSNFFIKFWHFIFSAGYGILAIAVFLYIFKIKFLDTQELENPIKEENTTPATVVSKEGRGTEKLKVKPTRVATKEFSLLDLFVKAITIGLKCCFLLILLPIVVGTISAVIGLVLSIILIFKGLFLGGPLLFLIALIIFGIVLIELILNFVFNLVFSKRRIIITLITSIVLGAIGFALSIWFFLNLTIINDVPTLYKLKEQEESYQMSDDLLIQDSYYRITYIDDETIGNEVKVKISYYNEFNNAQLLQEGNEVKVVHKQQPNLNNKKLLDNFISNLKNNQIYTYSHLNYVNMTITASKQNIQHLLKNGQSRYTNDYNFEDNESEEVNELDDSDEYNY